MNAKVIFIFEFRMYVLQLFQPTAYIVLALCDLAVTVGEMASNLDAKLSEAHEKGRSRSDRLSKPRLVADPGTTHKDIMDAVRNFLNAKDTKDLASLVVPHGLRVMKWNSTVDSDWLLKVAPLVYDILSFAANSKISGKKTGEALRKLLVGSEIKNSTNKSDKDFVDHINMLIRIALSQYRIIKVDLKEREKTMRRLEKPDKTRFNLILEKMQLPADFEVEETDDEKDVPLMSPPVSKSDSRDSLAVVPYTSEAPNPKASSSVPGFDLSHLFEDVLTGCVAPGTPEASSTQRTKESIGFTSGEKRQKQMSVGLKLSLSFTAKMEVSKKFSSKTVSKTVSKKKADKMEGSGSKEDKTKENAGEDHDLLEEAMGHVPKMASELVKKKPAASMKRPASAILPEDDQPQAPSPPAPKVSWLQSFLFMRHVTIY